MKPSRQEVNLTFLAVFGVATLAAACASGAGGEAGPRRDPNMLTAEEMAEFASLNCMDVVQRLRPRWLQGRAGDAVIVRDGSLMGLAEDFLSRIPVGDVQSIKYLSATDATLRYGTGVTGGAIIVTSRSR